MHFVDLGSTIRQKCISNMIIFFCIFSFLAWKQCTTSGLCVHLQTQKQLQLKEQRKNILESALLSVRHGVRNHLSFFSPSHNHEVILTSFWEINKFRVTCFAYNRICWMLKKTCTSKWYKNTDAYTQSALMRTKVELIFGSKAQQALNIRQRGTERTVYYTETYMKLRVAHRQTRHRNPLPAAKSVDWETNNIQWLL